MYANPIKNTLKSEGALILAQAGKQHALFTKKLPLTPEQKLGMDISFDTLIAICTYHAGAHTSRNQGIIDAITQPQADSDINIALQYSTSQDRNGALPTLATTCEYTPTYKDYALLTADSIASNLINHAPLAEHNEVYISCNNEAYTLLSKNLLLRAGKESSKDMIHQVTAAYLSSNKDNLDYNPSRLAKKTVGIIAEHTAKEVSYGLVAQLIHNKIVPSATTKTATLLKTFFPADGVPKDNTQEITRLVTIGTITFCAATGLTLAKNAGSWTLENVISPYLGRMSQ